MRLSGWVDAARETSVSQRKKERERQALLSWAGLLNPSDFCYSLNIVCLFRECGLSFISFVPLCFVYISEGRKEARALFLKELEATGRKVGFLYYLRCVRVGRED